MIGSFYMRRGPRPPLMTSQLEAWRSELREVQASWEYAFGMGHGCTIGRKSAREKAAVRRAQWLQSLIAEHTHASRTPDS